MSSALCRFYSDQYSRTYICKISSRSISSNQLEVVGFHDSSKGNSDVKRLILESCTFDAFPRNLHELFPNLSVLWIEKCKLELISREDFAGLRGLRELSITECGLKCLQGDLLRDLKQLQAVSFTGNQLSEIEPDILDGLQHLTFVSFKRNATIDTWFDNSNSYSVSLDVLKAEIKLKCKPKEPQPVECEFSVDQFGEYCCQVSAQRIARPQLKFIGKHKGERSANAVDELFFENCTFVELPKNFHEFFPKLSILRMKNCTLNELNYENISGLENLREFYLQNCNVEGETKGEPKQFACISLQGYQAEDIESEMKKSKKFFEFLFDDAFKDFTIKVGEASFKIHKILFAAHSATLAEIFKNNPEAVELNLQDVSEAIFKVIYGFLYSEKLPEDFDNWTELCVALNQLKIKYLTRIAAYQLQKNITDANAQSVLELANKFNHEDLREAAFEYLIKKHFPNTEIKKELSKEPEKLKELIKTKLNIDREHEEIMKKMEKLKIEISKT